MTDIDTDYSSRFTDRTQRLVGEATVRSLRDRCFVVAGCGGVGGAAAIMLARMGVSRFLLADPGRFDPPDANRQWAANASTMGANKSRSYAEILSLINPDAHVVTVPEGVTPGNVPDIVASADVVLDCLDVSVSIDLRAKLYEHCRRRGVYCISAPVLGFGVLLAASLPDGASMDPFIELLKSVAGSGKIPAALRQVFAPMSLDAIERDLPGGKVPSLAIGPTLGAAFASTEALVVLAGRHSPIWRQPLCLPRVLAVDALRMKYEFLDIDELLIGANVEAAA
jgi:molybdopterin/thiamine biosynthesis adenylyltransferase